MKIIIADDEFANRLLVSEIVRNMGHELIEAENGEEALRAIQKTPDIDLVLMDIEMPVMNGVDAARLIRKKLDRPLNRIPIVAMSGYELDDIKESSGPDDF
jgi:CheY-like chemotaxis protein